MKIRAVAFALALCGLQACAFAQQLPMMPAVKTGKLVPGDTLNITIFKKPDQKIDAAYDGSMVIGFRNDGTIAVPLLFDKVPAAGLTMSQLTIDLQQRYTSYFEHFGPSPNFTPPRIMLGFLGHRGGTALDNLIKRLGK